MTDFSFNSHSLFDETVGSWFRLEPQNQSERFDEILYRKQVRVLSNALVGFLEKCKDTPECRDRAVFLVPSKKMASDLLLVLQDAFPSPVVGMEYVEAEWASDDARLKQERRRELRDPNALLRAVMTEDWNSDLLAIEAVEHLVVCGLLPEPIAEELAARIGAFVEAGQTISVTDFFDNQPFKLFLDGHIRQKPTCVASSQKPTSAHRKDEESTEQAEEEKIVEASYGDALVSSPTTVLRFHWTGPFYLEELSAFSSSSDDLGLFQIYGTHPVYGQNVLLQIGAATTEPFGKVILEKGWLAHPQASTIHFFLGRLVEKVEPLLEWIKKAEALSILAHAPAFNEYHELEKKKDSLRQLHLLHWGEFRSMMPEVSGIRWV